MIVPSFHVPACVAPAVSVGFCRYKSLRVVTPLHSGAKVHVPSVPVTKLVGALSLNGESRLIQRPPMDCAPVAYQSNAKATTTPPPKMYACRLLPSVVGSM